MKITYALQAAGHGGYFNLQTVMDHLDKYHDRVGIAPGVIYMGLPMYKEFMMTLPQQPQSLPLSKEKRFLHLTTVYGVIPVIPEYKNNQYEISFNVSEEFEREFEKIVLGE